MVGGMALEYVGDDVDSFIMPVTDPQPFRPWRRMSNYDDDLEIFADLRKAKESPFHFHFHFSPIADDDTYLTCRNRDETPNWCCSPPMQQTTIDSIGIRLILKFVIPSA